jgi:trigger factor
MMVLVQSTSVLERRLEVSVPAAEVEQAFESRLKAFSRTARLKGFRPGKAPLNVVKRQFGPQLRDEVVGELVRSTLAEALDQQKLLPVDGPRIEPLSLAAGQDLRYAAIFEVYPQIEVRGLEDIEIVRPSAEVTTGDVDAMLENLRRQRPEFVPATRPAQDGDRVVVDFEGRIDGVAFEGGKGENVTVELGSLRMLRDFEEGLKGASAGETRVVSVQFPSDYGKPELAGRTAEFTISVRSVEEMRLPEVDEAFCREFGVAEGGVEQLRREVEDNMRRELEQNVRGRMKTQLFDKLLAANPIELPKAAVEQQLRELQLDWLRRIGAAGRKLEEAPPREPFEAAARRRVALGLLVGELVRREQLRPDPAQIEERIESAAASYPDPEQAARQIRDSRELRAQLESMVLEDQVVEHLLGRVKVIEQPSTFRELMNFGA